MSASSREHVTVEFCGPPRTRLEDDSVAIDAVVSGRRIVCRFTLEALLDAPCPLRYEPGRELSSRFEANAEMFRRAAARTAAQHAVPPDELVVTEAYG